MIIPIIALSLSLIPPASFSSPSIQLKKKGELSGLSAAYSFRNIDDICSDAAGDIYVSDSGRNEILIFSRDNNPIGILGTEGQGPGEFLGMPGRAPIFIFHGGSKFLYVTDLGNRRLTVFEKRLVIYEFNIPKAYMNRIVGDGYGHFYIISDAGHKLIIQKSVQSGQEEAFFERKYHYSYPIAPPPWERKWISEDEVQVELVKGVNDIIVFSNHSLKAFRYEDIRLKKVMLIQQEGFIKDFGTRLAKRIKANSFINPLKFHTDFRGNLCFAYANSEKARDEFYIYGQDGDFLGILFLPGRTVRTYCFTPDGALYVIEDSTKIGIYDYAAGLSGLMNGRGFDSN